MSATVFCLFFVHLKHSALVGIDYHRAQDQKQLVSTLKLHGRANFEEKQIQIEEKLKSGNKNI